MAIRYLQSASMKIIHRDNDIDDNEALTFILCCGVSEEIN